MKQMLYSVNLTDEEGRLNLIHAIVIGLFINLFINHSVESCYLLLGGFALLAWNLKVNPPIKAKKYSQEELELVKKDAKLALDQIKKLNLQIGFRAA